MFGQVSINGFADTNLINIEVSEYKDKILKFK
jgi:hypothetical protein